MTYTEHITSEGERWDTVAYKAYGTVDDITLEDGSTVNAIAHILTANRGFAIMPILEAGMRLLIPIIPTVAIEIDTNELPPWKQ